MSKEILIQRYLELGESFSEVPDKIALRVNTFKISPEQLTARLLSHGVILKKIPFVNNGYWVEKSKFSLGACTEFLRGYFYLQEAAAQLPAEVLNPLSSDIVLDCCASPGGKTTYLAQLMQNKGSIVALEFKQSRLISLKSNLERINANNVLVYNMDARNANHLNLQFDKILLDAPCSGNFVTDKSWFDKRKIEDFVKSSELQKQLLKSAVGVLKNNGLLLYSTCTLEPEENELVIDWALKNLPVKLELINLHIGDVGLTNVFGRQLSEEIVKCRRFWPWKTNTEGFFIALLKKC